MLTIIALIDELFEPPQILLRPCGNEISTMYNEIKLPIRVPKIDTIGGEKKSGGNRVLNCVMRSETTRRHKDKDENKVVSICADRESSQCAICKLTFPACAVPSGLDKPDSEAHCENIGCDSQIETQAFDNTSWSNQVISFSSDHSQPRALRVPCVRACGAAKPMPKRYALVIVSKLRSPNADVIRKLQSCPRWGCCKNE